MDVVLLLVTVLEMIVLGKPLFVAVRLLLLRVDRSCCCRCV
jgi:hypothetical protein